MRIPHASLALLLLVIPCRTLADPLRVMTFTGVPRGGGSGVFVWVEDGITARGNIDSSLSVPDSVHLDALDGSTPFWSRIDFTTGSLFEAVSVDIRPAGSGFTDDCVASPFANPVPAACQGLTYDDPIDYIHISGYLGGALVASMAFYRPRSSEFEAISLDAFPTIDLLRVKAVTYLELGLTGYCPFSTGCGHFDVDNVLLTPEPRAFELLTVALLGAAALRARHGRQARAQGNDAQGEA